MSAITASARYAPCVNCGRIGSTCARHYNGIRQHLFGKGIAIKCHDIASADLCHICDKEFTEGNTKKLNRQEQIEYSEQFLYLIILSNISRHERGIL